MTELTNEEYAKLLEGARRIEGGQGRETAGASMDCDYGHDLIEEVLTALTDRVRRETLAEVEQRIEKRAAGYDHPNQWVARDLLQIVAREVRGLAEAGEGRG